jgi:hypothetical protein
MMVCTCRTPPPTHTPPKDTTVAFLVDAGHAVSSAYIALFHQKPSTILVIPQPPSAAKHCRLADMDGTPAMHRFRYNTDAVEELPQTRPPTAVTCYSPHPGAPHPIPAQDISPSGKHVLDKVD